MTPLLEAKNITKVFGGGLFDKTKTVALRNFSMSLERSPATITAVVGESGSGKTTLARLLLGATDPTEGEVLYKGKDMRNLNKAERRAFLNDVQVIFQDPFEVYNPFYRVEHVLTMPIEYLKLANSQEQKWDMVEEALETVGLRPDETIGRYPHQLSGGQRQRVMVARALIIKPSIILADEPVSMIDASLRATVLGSLQRLKDEFSISIIYITHDLTTAFQIADNIIVLYRGTVTEVGDVVRVVQEPQHPYTQLLVGSIPNPDPNHPWAAEGEPALPNQKPGEAYCPFVDRCPMAMERCLHENPPMYRTEEYRGVTCFLYDGTPIISKTEMDEVFITANSPPPTASSGMDAEVTEKVPA